MHLPTLKNTLLILSVLITFYGLYQYIFFNGNYSSLWNFEFVLRGKIEKFQRDPRFVQYTFLRNGNLRSSSVFVSPIEYGLFLVAPSLICFNSLFEKRNLLFKVGYFLLFAIFFLGLLSTQVRATYISLAVGIITILLLRIFKRLNFKILLIGPLTLAVMTFLYLLSGFLIFKDSSALGRIAQYAKFPKVFELMGKGIGAPVANTAFDSWYLSSAAVFGIMSPIYIVLTFYIFNQLYKLKRKASHSKIDVEEKGLLNVTIAYFCSFIFIFAFHYSIASAQILLLYLLSFLMISKLQYRILETKTI